jgi:hypothetical protein
VDARDAIWTGVLNNNTKFFGGSSSTETIATALNNYGGSWSWDRSDGIFSSFSWLLTGSNSAGGTQAGIFAFFPHNGGSYEYASHRTILSGY